MDGKLADLQVLPNLEAEPSARFLRALADERAGDRAFEPTPGGAVVDLRGDVHGVAVGVFEDAEPCQPIEGAEHRRKKARRVVAVAAVGDRVTPPLER